MTNRADQFACTERVLEITPNAVIVSNLGTASYVLAAVAARDRNFYQWGSMGVTTPVGLGLALTTNEQVTVFEGDGSLLMSLGELSTVGEKNPANLTIVVWDNAVYGTTGGQPSHTDSTDLAGVAQNCGVAATHVSTETDFTDAYRNAVKSDRSELLVCDVDLTEVEARPPFDFASIKRRVRDTLTDQ